VRRQDDIARPRISSEAIDLLEADRRRGESLSACLNRVIIEALSSRKVGLTNEELATLKDLIAAFKESGGINPMAGSEPDNRSERLQERAVEAEAAYKRAMAAIDDFNAHHAAYYGYAIRTELIAPQGLVDSTGMTKERPRQHVGSRHAPRAGWNRPIIPPEAVLSCLRRRFEEFGYVPTTDQWRAIHGTPSVPTILKRFGGWHSAWEAAIGVDHPEMLEVGRRRWSRQ